MNVIRTFNNLVNSQHLHEGVRLTTGILVPALLMAYFNLLPIGIQLSLGAMCASITDSAGPIHHRRNGMVATILSVFVVACVVGFSTFSPWLLGAVILVMCFFFSMLNVYGTRAGAVGIASLLILVLNIDDRLAPADVLARGFYLASGGLWYLSFSLLLYNVRPYKPAQIALGNSIQHVADYLRLRAEFYRTDVDYDANYRRLLQQQVLMQERQNMVAELLFKTRSIVQDNTATGRILMMIYLDMADVMERIMSTYQYYQTLHRHFDEMNILPRYRRVALVLANDIEDIGIAIKSGTASHQNEALAAMIKDLRAHLDQLRETHMHAGNLEGFINLRRILENLEDIHFRVQTLHRYTTYDSSLAKKQLASDVYQHFISHQDITPEMLVNNCNMRSDIFRHSLRVSLAVGIGYVGSLFFPLGHSYWILLTIVVILKPAYSLSQSRNRDRLLGTVIGALVGLAIVYLVYDKTALLFIMIVLMTGTYTFLRTRYFLSVVLMTPYIILFFHLLNPGNFQSVFTDRLIDTAIGSVIAFAATKFFFPAWEREKVMTALQGMVLAIADYFGWVTCMPSAEGKQQNRQQQSRREALVALANLSDAFNRMLSEPRSQQQNIEEIHRFVVMCHMLMSHLATLAQLGQRDNHTMYSAGFCHLASLLQPYIAQAGALLQGRQAFAEIKPLKEALRQVSDQAATLLQQRQAEIEQGMADTPVRRQLVQVKSLADQYNFIFNLATDLHKSAARLAPKGTGQTAA